MKKFLAIAILLVLGSASLHALTPSCDVFQKNFEGWQKANVAELTSDNLLQQYLHSSQTVFEAWCGAQPASSSVRMQAVTEYVEAYRAQRFNDSMNQQVRATTGLQMLALLGLTHELPSTMQSDKKLREAWIQDCQDACFSKVGDSAEVKWQMNSGMQIRNDLIDNLRAGPGVESVKRMLWEAPTAVLD